MLDNAVFNFFEWNNFLNPCLDEVVPELGLDRLGNIASLEFEKGFFKFRNHLARSEFTEVAAFFLGGAVAVLFGKIFKAASSCSLVGAVLPGSSVKAARMWEAANFVK